MLRNHFAILNVYKKKSIKSEITTQMLYGDTFSVQKKIGKWLKIKIKDDKYVGFIIKKNYPNYLHPTHKVSELKVATYEDFRLKTKSQLLPFGSKIVINKKNRKFSRFDKRWIANKDIKPINFEYKNIFSRIKIFENIKYKWGGKSFKGIDCSALIQIFLNFNNRFCPRDTRDQIKYFKKNVNLKNIKKNDIIYGKGQVAVVLSKKKLIHAYGPLKKTVIMDIKKTIKKIDKTAKLKLKLIKRIK